MIHRRVRASIWKLLLPMPLAIAIIALAGIAGRRAWYPTPGHWVRSKAARPAPTTGALQPSRTPEERPAPQTRHRGLESGAPAARTDSGSPERSARAAGDVASEQHASLPEIGSSIPEVEPPLRPERALRPAPESVAPSFEAALRASEPPPAAARAPKLASAPVVPLVPAPEPIAPPQVSPMQTAEPSRSRPKPQHVRAVRFDAGYYYGRGRTARQLAAELTESWREQGVNLVYFYAYNRVYGARYRTSYPGNIMEDYGRQDLLGHMLREAHRRGIKVVAWVQGVQHKQIWESHPDWRQKNADGSDYKPDADSYFLCVRNPEVMQWWLGLLDELLRDYPDLDGIDLAEFQLDLWGDHACHCAQCRSQFAQAHPSEPVPGRAWRKFRGEGLTRLLLASSRLAHSYDKEVHITTVFTARRDGTLMSSAQVRDAIGFDLEGVLSSPDRPDVLQGELIWQQWAALYNDRATFRPQWTKTAVRQAQDMLRGRARLIAHVEVTDFGVGGLDGPALARTIASAAQGGATGIDIYDAHLLAEVDQASRHLQMAWLDLGG